MLNRLRLFAAAAAIAVPTATLAAQTANVPFTKGDRVASIGLVTGGDNDGTGLAGSVEWGVLSLTPKVQLGLGVFAGFQRNSQSVGAYKSTATVVPVMAVGNVHLPIESQPKLDLYAGASVGFIRASISNDSPGTANADYSNTDSAVGAQVGARFTLASKLSVVGQLGLGDLPLLFAGISIKF